MCLGKCCACKRNFKSKRFVVLELSKSIQKKSFEALKSVLYLAVCENFVWQCEGTCFYLKGIKNCGQKRCGINF